MKNLFNKSKTAHRMQFDSYKKVFSSVKSTFPWPNYLDNVVYIQTKVILHGMLKYTQSSPENCKLLDIGCGPMEKTAIFSKFGFDCFAVDDLSDPWHRQGKNMDKILTFAKECRINFHLQSPDDYSIPFAKQSFDVVTAIEVIEHLHNSPKGFLEVVLSYLKPGGIFIITTPNSVNLRKRLSVIRGNTNYPRVNDFYESGEVWRGHVREYTLDELIWSLRMAGFNILYANTYEHFAYNKLKGLKKYAYIALGYLHKYFRSGLIIVAQKGE